MFPTSRISAGALPSIVAFVLLMAAYHAIFGGYFPLPNGRMGHDYVLTLPVLVDGLLWFRNNGPWTPPWFTPSFCAGQAFFADPQIGYYVLGQWLAFVLDPVRAVYASVLAFAAVGYWGMVLFCRDALGAGRAAAVAAAAVYLFNGFYIHRMIVGHFGFQPVMLVPLTAWLLVRAPRAGAASRTEIHFGIAAGVTVAVWLHGGMATLMLPAAASVLALACLAALRGDGVARRVAVRGAIAGVVALGLSAVKLTAGLTLYAGFTRTYYPLPGFGSVSDLLGSAFSMFFYSSQHAFQTITPLWKNLRWTQLPHELAFGLTLVCFAVLLAGAGRWLLHQAREGGVPRPRAGPLVLLLAVLLLPLALLYHQPEWTALLQRLPVFGSTTAPQRWLVIWIAPVAALVALAADQPGLRTPALWLCVLAVPALNGFENRDYYRTQGYDTTRVTAFARDVRAGRLDPRIEAISIPRDARGRTSTDETEFTRGRTPLYCYNPLYGYRLERYVAAPLVEGPVEREVAPGKLNLRNPACLVYPGENQCAPWDPFRTSQRDAARAFAGYQAYDFAVPWRHRFASWITQATLAAVFAWGLGLAGAALLRRG